MANYVSKIIKFAEDEVGYKEKKNNSNLDDKNANAGSANYTKYARDLDAIDNFYNGKKQGFPWCDVFVDWLFVQAFGVDEAKRLLHQPDKSYGAGVDWSARYFKENNKLYKEPEIGDQIFFLDSSGDPGHTGIVCGVDEYKVYTIEGNTSPASGVVDNGGMVCKKEYKLDYKNIYGYGRPDYDPELVCDTKEENNMEIRYNNVEEMPDYAKGTVNKLMNKEYLKGETEGLDLSHDMMRLLVILDRAGVFGE